MYILNFIDDLNNFIKPAKEWLFDNYNNPLLWVGIVIVVLSIFGIVYAYLHKDEL